jgi:hypothetical protein
MPCSVVAGYQSFGGPCYSLHQGEFFSEDGADLKEISILYCVSTVYFLDILLLLVLITTVALRLSFKSVCKIRHIISFRPYFKMNNGPNER